MISDCYGSIYRSIYDWMLEIWNSNTDETESLKYSKIIRCLGRQEDNCKN